MERMKNIKWLFFDVGSTLVDEEAAYEHRFREIAYAAGKPLAEVLETARALYRQNRKGDRETAAYYGVPLPTWNTEAEILYPDAARCLEVLHRQYRIGIIANQVPGTAARLQAHGIGQYLDLVVASAEEGVAKPDPRIFRIALERAGCRPEEAVMIGDRVDNDILPAKGLGMHTVWIRQGFGGCWTVSDDTEKADREVSSLTALLSVF